jgi:hypothetical protein
MRSGGGADGRDTGGGLSGLVRPRSLPAVAVCALTLALGGCGSSGDGTVRTPTPTATTPPALPTARSGAVLKPIFAPLSANTAGYQPSQARSAGVPHSARAAAGPTPAPIALDHFFYLVNAINLPTPDAQGIAPAPSATPYVLTVNGAPPAGAPDPNGGTGVGLVLFNPDAAGTQLWKAVAASDGYFYLRSAESFVTQQNDFPSMLTGYGASAAFLDLGFYSNWNTSIFWNQSASPTGDNSAFQQWTYDTSNAQLTNRAATGQLYNDSPTAWVASQPPAPGNQWYAYPNYELEQVVVQPNSSPPFPAAADAGEQAAYEYISVILLGAVAAAQPCTLEGTDYNGIRCEYANLNATDTLTSCAAQTSPLSPPLNPGSYNGTTISAADWQATYTQLNLECQYAAQVQTMYANFNTILNAIFTADETAIASLAADVGLSENQSLNPIPIDIIEGILYTALGATGDTGMGVFANLMETAVNTAVAAGGNQAESLTQSLLTTVGTLYSDLATQFQVLQQNQANGENAILQDWGRLQQIGPLTLINGYNGLGLNADQFATIEAAALKGYQVTVMQQLMAVAPWALNWEAATSFSSVGGPPSSAQYSYAGFGSLAGYNNAWLEDPSHASNYPDSQVIDTDILGNGGNAFELFNGLNGWTALPSAGLQNLSCYGMVVTLFNATPTDLQITVAPDEGFIAAPGSDFSSHGEQTGYESSYTFELRPYGYLPIYAGSNSSSDHLNVWVYGYEPGGTQVVSFNFGVGHACGSGDDFGVTSISGANGYSFSPNPFATKTSGNADAWPWGAWSTIVNSSLTPQ